MKLRHLFIVLGCILVFILLTTSCSTANSTSTSVKVPTSTTAATSSGPAVPTGELIAALTDFGNENFVPWLSDNGASRIDCLIYDALINWDEVGLKTLPGLAESWEVSPDALTTTFHIRKGVQFSDGWGELTAEDIKYNFEGQASKDSRGYTPQARNIASMEIPDPKTLVVRMKKPMSTFLLAFSLGNSGTCQGIVSKKYVETVGITAASQKPIGTGPFKMVDSQLGSYYKFEALNSHWRIVPEFKNLTVRLMSETSTLVAALKEKEIDLATIPAEQMEDLKSAGVATEASKVGGFVVVVHWGGIAIPEDDRYDASRNNKDPWTDVRVRKAMAIAIDRQAICKAVFAGAAYPAGVPLFTPGMDKWQYSFDPVAAKQLLSEAGYPNGFSFRFISYTQAGIPETPRVVEAMAGYWQQIGLDPKITAIDYSAYNTKNRLPLDTAGDISLAKCGPAADLLDKGATWLMPNYPMTYFQDEGSYAIWKEGVAKVNLDERAAYVEKLNQYYFENYGPMPVVRNALCYAWNSAKISAWPHPAQSTPDYLEYVRHAHPLNTFRLFSPWPDR